MKIRLAVDAEGQDILKLFPNSDKMDPNDWNKIAPYWAVAEVDGEIVAALQLCPSLPTGRVEHLNIKPDLNKITAMKAAHALIKYAEVAMMRMGCTTIAGYVTFRNKGVKRLIQKHYGAQVVGSGSMLSWRI